MFHAIIKVVITPSNIPVLSTYGILVFILIYISELSSRDGDIIIVIKFSVFVSEDSRM